MPAKILELIEKIDHSETVRDEIAAIIKLESENQQELAALESKDPRLWDLRVFIERANPWSEFEVAPDQLDGTPIVNVHFDTESIDLKGSGTVEQQTYDGVFNIDCYGYGVSADNPDEYDEDGGHTPGDEEAAREAQRAARLVRNILMAGAHTYLGLRGIVGRRYVQSITAFQPPIDARPVQRICGVRIVLHVRYVETSPQVSGQPFETVFATALRLETGEIYFTALYGDSF